MFVFAIPYGIPILFLKDVMNGTGWVWTTEGEMHLACFDNNLLLQTAVIVPLKNRLMLHDKVHTVNFRSKGHLEFY